VASGRLIYFVGRWLERCPVFGAQQDMKFGVRWNGAVHNEMLMSSESVGHNSTKA
jgi:hypothetical protein